MLIECVNFYHMNVDTISLIVGIAGLVVGVVSLFYAGSQYKDRRRLEQFVKVSLRQTAGNIAKIHQSSSWAVANSRDARDVAVQLPESELKPKLLKFMCDGIGDVYATDRSLTNLYNDVLNMQEAQFGTRDVTHPQRDELEIYKKEQAQKKKQEASNMGQ